MKKYFNILLTGFEAFDGDDYNPSKEYVLTRSQFFKKHHIKSLILPVSFKGSYKIVEAELSSKSYDLIIQLGLAKNRSKISLEKVALNWDDARIPDADQDMNHGRIDLNSPDGIFTKLDLMKLRSDCDQSKIEISYSAGTYVCNHLYFKTLANFSNVDTIFIHLPGTKHLNDKNQWKDEELFLTLDEIIEKIIL